MRTPVFQPAVLGRTGAPVAPFMRPYQSKCTSASAIPLSPATA